MLIYVVFVYFSLFIGTLICRDNKNQNRMFYSIIMFTSCWLFTGLRDITVGTDTESYVTNIYLRIANSNNLSDILNPKYPLFSAFCKLISLLGDSPRVYLMCTSLFITFGITVFIYKYSHNIVLAWFLYFGFYFFFNGMTAVRQYMSVVLLINSWGCLVNKKTYKVLLMLTAATLIHYISIVFIAIFAVFFFKPKISTYLIFTSLGLTFAITFEHFMNLFIRLFPFYEYFSLYNYHQGRITLSLVLKQLTTFIYLLIFIASYIQIRKGNVSRPNEDRAFIQRYPFESKYIIYPKHKTSANLSYSYVSGEWGYHSNIVFLVIITRVAFIGVETSGRFFLWLEILSLISIPFLLEKGFSYKNIKIVYVIVMLIFSGAMIYQLSINHGGIVPYRLF